MDRTITLAVDVPADCDVSPNLARLVGRAGSGTPRPFFPAASA